MLGGPELEKPDRGEVGSTVSFTDEGECRPAASWSGLDPTGALDSGSAAPIALIGFGKCE